MRNKDRVLRVSWLPVFFFLARCFTNLPMPRRDAAKHRTSFTMKFTSLIVSSCLAGSPIVTASRKQEKFRPHSVLRGGFLQVVDPTPPNDIDDDVFPPDKDNYWTPVGQTLNEIDKETWESTGWKVALSYHDGSLDDAASLTLAQAYPLDDGKRGVFRGGKILTFTYVPRLQNWIPLDDPIYVEDTSTSEKEFTVVADLALDDSMLAYSTLTVVEQPPAASVRDAQVHVNDLCSTYSSNGRLDVGWCPMGPETGIQNDSKNKEHEAFGFSISVNYEHNLVAVGTVVVDSDPDFSSSGTGRVEVFRFDYNEEDDQGPCWNRSGNQIVGDHPWFGQVVKLSDNGNVLAALGSHANVHEGGDIHCLIRVYERSGNDQDWVQKGRDITDDHGQGPDYMSCDNMDMSKDGTTVLAGMRQEGDDGVLKGHVRVWSFDEGTRDWIQKGADLDTLLPTDDSRNIMSIGSTLSISDDGNRVVLSDQIHTRHIDESKVWTFDWDGSSWDHKNTGSIRTNGAPSDLHMANKGENLVVALPEAMDGYGAVVAFKLDRNGVPNKSKKAEK